MRFNLEWAQLYYMKFKRTSQSKKSYFNIPFAFRFLVKLNVKLRIIFKFYINENEIKI